MIHAAPTIDLTGFMDIKSLEVGHIELNKQAIPAVRFKIALKDQLIYPLLATGPEAGEIYAYSLAANTHQITHIDVRISGTLMLDWETRLHVIVNKVTWYTSQTLRERAAHQVVGRFGKGEAAWIPHRTEAFAKVERQSTEY